MVSSLDLEQLYRQYGYFVLKQCRKFLKNEEDAKDAMQEVFLKIGANLHTLEKESSLFPWIYRTTINHCLNQLEKNKLRSIHELLDEERHGTSDQRRVFEWRDLAEFVLGNFDPQTREIAFSYYIDELNQEEIAQLLGMTRRTVYNRLQKFKEKCSRLLASAGLSISGEP